MLRSTDGGMNWSAPYRVPVNSPHGPVALSSGRLVYAGKKLWEVPNVPPYMTYWALYGDPRMKDPLMMHHWCYTERQLVQLMQTAGLIDLRGEPPRFHQPVRDMRVTGRKPAAESLLVAA